MRHRVIIAFRRPQAYIARTFAQGGRRRLYATKRLVGLLCLASVVLLQACTVEQSEQAPAPSSDVEFVVRGAVDTTITSGLAAVDHAASTTGESSDRFTLSLQPRRRPDPVVVLSPLPLTLGPGQYVLGGPDSTREFSAYFARIDDAEQIMFARDVRGTLAITDTSGGWTGRFRFGANLGYSDSTEATRETDSLQVSTAPRALVVEGAFRNIPRLTPGH